VGAGASWGNAGWLTPALTAPLPEPAVLRYGLRAVLSPRSPVYLPIRADRDLLRFLVTFVRHSTARQWRRGMSAYVPLNERALEAFDVLAAGGVTASTKRAGSFLACFAREPGRLHRRPCPRRRRRPDRRPLTSGPLQVPERQAGKPVSGVWYRPAWASLPEAAVPPVASTTETTVIAPSTAIRMAYGAGVVTTPGRNGAVMRWPVSAIRQGGGRLLRRYAGSPAI
jgi:hypothetical protein